MAATANTMRAVVYDRSKSSGRRFDTSYPIPKVKSGQVLVKVSAASVNPVDYKLPSLFVNKTIVGLDFAGYVTEIGKGAEGFAVGDKVFGNTRGTLCDYAVCDPNKIAKVPEGLSMVQAAAMPTAYLTSYQALMEHGFEIGKNLLVIGASGGVGSTGVQLGKALGASKVVGLCSAANEKFVRELGADEVVDYKTQNVVDVYGEKSFDFVYDTASHSGAGEDYKAQAHKLLKDKNSSYIWLNGPAIEFLRLMTIGFPKKHGLILTKHSKKDLESIAELMKNPQGEEGFRFLPVIAKVFPFTPEGVEEAYELLHTRRAVGKIVLDMEKNE